MARSSAAHVVFQETGLGWESTITITQGTTVNDLTHLADLIRIRNFVNSSISKIINHPAEVGHIAEYLLGKILDIELHDAANIKATDGIFRTGALAGKSVNVKYRAAQNRLLNLEEVLDPSLHAHFYLAVQGPKSPSKRSAGRELPFLIDSMYLFESTVLIPRITKPGQEHLGRFVPTALWQEAMVYPEQINQALILTDEQKAALTLFAP